MATGATLVADKVKVNDARFAVDAKPGSTLQITISTMDQNIIEIGGLTSGLHPVTGIMLHLLASDSLLTGDLAILIAIAGQCPLEGGDAVYEARSIVAYYTVAGFDDSQLCAGANNRASEPEQSSLAKTLEDVVLYPNPTTGQLYWSGTTGLVTLRIFNTLGVLQLERQSANNYLDVSTLPDGIYTLQLLAADNTLLANRKLLEDSGPYWFFVTFGGTRLVQNNIWSQ